MFSDEQKKGIIERQESNTKATAFELAILALPSKDSFIPLDQYEMRTTALMLQAERISKWLGGSYNPQ